MKERISFDDHSAAAPAQRPRHEDRPDPTATPDDRLWPDFIQMLRRSAEREAPRQAR